MSDYFTPRIPPQSYLDYMHRKWQILPLEGIVIGSRGKEIGSEGASGHVQVSILLPGKVMVFKRSHVIWYEHYGFWPRMLLDHKDRVKTNDKIGNLRECTQTENMANTDAAIRRSAQNLTS